MWAVYQTLLPERISARSAPKFNYKVPTQNVGVGSPRLTRGYLPPVQSTSFDDAVSAIWNALPSVAPTLMAFQKTLKTRLFSRAQERINGAPF